MWGENSSNEQHSFGKLPMLLQLGARKESNSEHSRASSSEHSRASSSGASCSSSGMQPQQRAARAKLQDQGAEQVPSGESMNITHACKHPVTQNVSAPAPSADSVEETACGQKKCKGFPRLAQGNAYRQALRPTFFRFSVFLAILRNCQGRAAKILGVSGSGNKSLASKSGQNSVKEPVSRNAWVL
jgi:hypothetical protein